MENEYSPKQKRNGYQPMPPPEFIAESIAILSDPNTKFISLEDFLKEVDNSE